MSASVPLTAPPSEKRLAAVLEHRFFLRLHMTHKASNGNWIGSVLKKTAIPFALVQVLSIAMGAWTQHYCPAAVRLRDALPPA